MLKHEHTHLQNPDITESRRARWRKLRTLLYRRWKHLLSFHYLQSTIQSFYHIGKNICHREQPPMSTDSTFSLHSFIFRAVFSVQNLLLWNGHCYGNWNSNISMCTMLRRLLLQQISRNSDLISVWSAFLGFTYMIANLNLWKLGCYL